MGGLLQGVRWSRSAASAAEYALMAALIGGVLLIVVLAFGKSVSKMLTDDGKLMVTADAVIGK